MSANSSSSEMPKVILGSRGSLLALAQTHETRDRLIAAFPELGAAGAIGIEKITSTGDMVRDRPLADVGGKGLFIKEVEDALLSGRIDVAIHSMKDMETSVADGTTITAVLPREDPRDAFVSPHVSAIEDLPKGARFGTASVRRRALLLNRRPDLDVVLFRGNVDTRLRKLTEGDAMATLLATCGLKRLGKADVITKILEREEMPPPVAQGAIAIQTRDGEASARDAQIRDWVAALDHSDSHTVVRAERAMLRALDGSCRTPISGHARLVDGKLVLEGAVLSLDGQQRFDDAGSGDPSRPEDLGTMVGEAILAQCGRGFLAV